MTTRETTSIVVPPFIAEPLATVCASGNHHGLVEPTLRVEDCGFRMLQAHKYASAMAFLGAYRWGLETGPGTDGGQRRPVQHGA
ncbi:hypothetical protein [Streptomyces vietnamensis]|uniref:Uncharacterized protein n=1 Tax=Streptomyces vietnamensis TaxID=362257 RepID=A0A0B5I1Z5_9ACTN|nr:hypothetical protein [Streptomyces vietnamensis]AJF68170.1 hypothetical protein SVTN_31215 [Streptomyces vietnamensis]